MSMNSSNQLVVSLVPQAGIEPARPKTHDFESFLLTFQSM